MATFKDGIPNAPQDIPNFAQDFCLMNGGTQAGVAGLYPLDTQRCYYFFGFPVEQVNFANCPKLPVHFAYPVRSSPLFIPEAAAIQGLHSVLSALSWVFQVCQLMGAKSRQTSDATNQS